MKKKLTKITSIKVRKVKAENIAINKDLGKAKNIESKLQTEKDHLMGEINQLSAKIQAEKDAQDAAIEKQED